MAAKRTAAKGYVLPDALPLHTVLTSVDKQKFKLGRSVGTGGFGEIYLASKEDAKEPTLAVKIEPHENGPLFVEKNFYICAAKPQQVKDYMKARGLSSLGMPVLRGFGSHEHKKKKYRFIVMDRYGSDLQKIFQGGKKLFSLKTSFALCVRVLDILEYIHEQGYVHNDVKAQNLLLGFGHRSIENEVYLVDFGLVSKYKSGNVHKELKSDARKAHDGTIEYTSRDAHIGAHSRRSDLEILGYNVVHWMSGNLPWMHCLTDPKLVQAQKKLYMDDIPALLKKSFGRAKYPAELETFLTYVANLDFDTCPDYEYCRRIFKQGLKTRKLAVDLKLDFSPVKKDASKKNLRKHVASKRQPVPTNSPASPSLPNTLELSILNGESGAVTRSGESLDGFSWQDVLCTNPEMLIRQASRQSEDEDETWLAKANRELEERRQAESLINPTQAMKVIMKRIQQREEERQNMSWQQQLQHLSHRKSNTSKLFPPDLAPNPLTPAMEEVIAMRTKRISFETDTPITPDPSDEESDNASEQSDNESEDVFEDNNQSSDDDEEDQDEDDKEDENEDVDDDEEDENEEDEDHDEECKPLKPSSSISVPPRNRRILGRARREESLARLLLKDQSICIDQQRRELKRCNEDKLKKMRTSDNSNRKRKRNDEVDKAPSPRRTRASTSTKKSSSSTSTIHAKKPKLSTSRPQTRSRSHSSRGWEWAKVLSSNPEDILRHSRQRHN